ncbi:hypothetical protein ACNKHX_11665 [Shigella flexneri]
MVEALARVWQPNAGVWLVDSALYTHHLPVPEPSFINEKPTDE